MIAMAWRSMYAETVNARMDDKALNYEKGYLDVGQACPVES